MEDGRLKDGKMEDGKMEEWKFFNLSIFQSFNLPYPSPTLAILS